MAEQKGRGGKKPKYQIADIGGSDLTPQDLSTERVLNFLIKGESPAADQRTDASDVSPDQERTGDEQTAAHSGSERMLTSLPSPATLHKKSLDHLFRRASAGPTTAKDRKPASREPEHPEQAFATDEAKTVEPVQPATHAVQSKYGASPVMPSPQPPLIQRAAGVAAPPAQPHSDSNVPHQGIETQELKTDAAPAVDAENAELTQLTSLWKSFYRLKDGEIEALSVMYQMSHGQGSYECYVKMHKLAEMSNLTYRYCQKVVRSLEQLGWVTKLKDYDPATQLGVLYRVNLNPSL